MSSEERQGVRLKTRFETLYCSDRQEGEAVLADVSYSGALLESATKPAIGSSVMLYVRLPDSSKPVELRGKVVRHAPNGFAIFYDKPNPSVVRFVDDEAAIATLLEDDQGGSSLLAEDLDGSVPIANLLESVSFADLNDEDDTQEESFADVALEPVPIERTQMGDAPTGAKPQVGAPMLLSELDLSPYSISEIEALAERIPEVIATKRVEAKDRVLQKIKKLAEQEGFSLEELLDGSSS